MLDSISPSVLKKAIIGTEEEIQKDDSVAWINELLIFRSADINKPILKDSYDISMVENGKSRTIQYISKNPERTSVDRLSVETIGNGEKPLKILASLNSQNPLFGSVVHLEMHFHDLNGQNILTRYKSKGWQKMISKDSTHYSIESEVLVN